MADEAFTKADIDKAVKDAVEAAEGKFNDKLEELSSKNAGLLDDLKKAQREARAAKDVTPEQLTAETERADKAENELAETKKQLTALTKERDKALKDLETEAAVARSNALNNKINEAIATGGVAIPLVPAFKALVKEGSNVELVDGDYVVTWNGKPAGEAIKAFLDGDDGKHYRAAMDNGGGGAPGGRGSQGGGKTATRSQFDAMSHPERAEFSKSGGKVVDEAA